MKKSSEINFSQQQKVCSHHLTLAGFFIVDIIYEEISLSAQRIFLIVKRISKILSRRKKVWQEKRAEKKKQDTIDEKKAEKKKQVEVLEKKRVAEAESREKLLEKMRTDNNGSAAKVAEDWKGTKIDLSV